MALPRTIATVSFPSRNYNIGPFRDGNGNHYLLFRASGDSSIMEVWKGDNGDAVWAEQDSGNKPNSSADLRSINAVQDGTKLKIATQATGGKVEYHIFGMSDDGSADTWLTTNEEVVASTTSDVDSCAIAVRSDGDIIIAYQDNRSGTDDRVSYAIFEGVSWSTGNAIDDGAAVEYFGVRAVIGESDKIHFFFKDDNNADVYHKSLTSGNSLSSAEVVNDTATDSIDTAIVAPIYYDAAGVERITVAWRDNTADHSFTSEIDDDGTPGAEEDATDRGIRSNDGALVVDSATDTVYLIFVEASVDDVWITKNINSGGWDTDVEVLDAVTVADISANLFQIDNGDTVVAYVYDDAGTIKYNELVVVEASLDIAPTAITSDEAIGSHQVNMNIDLAGNGIASAESFGTAVLSGGAGPAPGLGDISGLFEFDEIITADGNTLALNGAANKFLLSFTGYGMSPSVYITTRGAHQDGSKFLGYYLTPRQLTLIYRSQECSREEFWTARTTLINHVRPNRGTPPANELTLRKLLPGGEIRDIKVLIQTGPRFEARQTTQWDEWSFTESLMFLAPDPTFFDPTAISTSLIASSSNNLIFPTTFGPGIGLLFGGSDFDQTMNIPYVGTWEAFPTITLTGPMSSPTITHLGTNKVIDMKYDISAGEIVTIETAYGSKAITNDSGTNLIGVVSTVSDFDTFSIVPDPIVVDGLNQIRINAGSPTDAVSTFTVNYNTRYIGI